MTVFIISMNDEILTTDKFGDFSPLTCVLPLFSTEPQNQYRPFTCTPIEETGIQPQWHLHLYGSVYRWVVCLFAVKIQIHSYKYSEPT